MKSLKETIILSLASASLLIGIHQSMQYETVTEGITQSYWLFMVTVVLLIFLNINRTKKTKEPVVQKKQQKSPLKSNKR